MKPLGCVFCPSLLTLEEERNGCHLFHLLPSFPFIHFFQLPSSFFHSSGSNSPQWIAPYTKRISDGVGFRQAGTSPRLLTSWFNSDCVMAYSSPVALAIASAHSFHISATSTHCSFKSSPTSVCQSEYTLRKAVKSSGAAAIKRALPKFS